MSKWTNEDYEALKQTAHLSGNVGYKRFVELGGTRSFDAWEVKRRRIPMAFDRVALPAPVPEKGVESDFIGLSVGFADIETTFSNQPIVLYAAIADQFGNIQSFRKGSDITDDRQLVDDVSRALESYDIIVTWNGKLFDVPVLQGRLAFHGLRRMDINMHIDLMYYATGQFMRIGRKSLQSVSEYFEVSNEKTPLRVRQWNGAMAGKEEDYEAIVEHCDADVLVTRDVFAVLKRHVRNIHR